MHNVCQEQKGNTDKSVLLIVGLEDQKDNYAVRKVFVGSPFRYKHVICDRTNDCQRPVFRRDANNRRYERHKTQHHI